MSFDKDYLAQLILRDAEQLKQRAGGALPRSGAGFPEPARSVAARADPPG